MSEQVAAMKAILRDPVRFAALGGGVKLRAYQAAVAQAVLASIRGGLGQSFVVQFPRQSGKNELQAQLECYLLFVLSQTSAEIVKVAPTLKPQAQTSMRRLERALEGHPLTKGQWRREGGQIFRLGKARILFLSGAPRANVVGATASILLECDEAQDVLASKWDKDFAPMAAATNATRLFCGTAWTAQTLLARERRAAEAAQAQDGQRRVFVIGAETVAAEVPSYAAFVQAEVARRGRMHPLVRTQYFGEEIEAQAGMFPPERLALMRGDHAPCWEPQAGQHYALLVDVAGEDEGRTDAVGLANPERDATAATLVWADLSGLDDPGLQAPRYRVMARWLWVGEKHARLYGQLLALAEQWQVEWVVIDATGVGAGLASFLERSLPGRVLPFVFSLKSKSELGWAFLAAIDTGRFKDYAAGESCQAAQPSRAEPLAALFWEQAENCESVIVEGPGRMVRWGVPEGRRSARSGELLHDDLLLSAALVGRLEGVSWASRGPAVIVEGRDPLEAMDREGW